MKKMENKKRKVSSNEKNDDIEVKKCEKMKFPTMEEFLEKVEKEKPLKWSELDINQLYLVDDVEETMLDDNTQTGQRTAYIGMLRSNEDDESFRVWLPGVIGSKLYKAIIDDNNENKDIYIKPLGEKVSKNKRTYQDFKMTLYDNNKQ